MLTVVSVLSSILLFPSKLNAANSSNPGSLLVLDNEPFLASFLFTTAPGLLPLTTTDEVWLVLLLEEALAEGFSGKCL